MFFLVFCSLPCFAAWQGALAPMPKENLLTEPVSILLDFSKADYIRLEASQSYSDVYLSLIENKTNTTIKSVSFSSYRGLDEILLVHKSDCNECRVVLSAQAAADLASPYKLVSKQLDESNHAQIKYFKHLSVAGIHRRKATLSKQQEQRKIFLEKCASELKFAAEIKDSYWRHHALTLLAETQFDLGETENKTATLKQIIEETKGLKSDFRVHALYEFAATVSDVVKERALYDEGMAISQHLKLPRLYALGANYKAIGLVREARFKEAISYLTESRDILLKTRRWRDLIYPLHNLSWAYQRAGNLPASLAVASEQKILAERYQLADGVVLSNYNFAMTYGLMGEVSLAEGFLDSAIKQHSTLSHSSNLSAALGAFLMKEKAQRLLQYGAFKAADDYAKIMITRMDELGYPGRSADAKFILGEIAYAQGEIEQARRIYRDVIKYDQKNNRRRDKARHLLRLVELEMSQNNFIEASPIISEALNILATTEDYRTLARAFSMSIELQIKLKGIDDANSLLKRTKAFISQHSLKKEKVLFEYRQALLAESLADYDAALEHLRIARNLIEKTLPKIRRRDLRQTYLALQKSIFELNLKLELRSPSNNWQKSLALSETYRARTLAEKIKLLTENYSNDSELHQQRDAVLTKIQTQARSWHRSTRNDSVEIQLRETRLLGETLEKIEASIEAIKINENSITTPINANLLPAIKQHELIIYYFIGKDNSWMWSITSEGAKVFRLPAEKVLSDLVAEMMSELSLPPGARKKGAWEQLKVTQKLSSILLDPLLSDLNLATLKTITIIPDGPLNSLPFAALTLPQSKFPLISKFPISYSTSLLVKDILDKRLFNERANEQPNILISADPRLTQVAGLKLEKLRFSRLEAQAIKKMSGNNAVVLLAEQATKAKVISEASKPYSILHFATHGLLNKTEPLLSGLVFSSDNENGELWLAPEISRAKLSTSLVVLSACESSAGQYLAGEGLLSLSRAFIEGGAGQVIGALWKVQDQATASLLKHFYQNLLERNLPIAHSLSEAQMAIYSNKQHAWQDPYYWASFQLQGGGKNKRYASNKYDD